MRLETVYIGGIAGAWRQYRTIVRLMRYWYRFSCRCRNGYWYGCYYLGNGITESVPRTTDADFRWLMVTKLVLQYLDEKCADIEPRIYVVSCARAL